MDKQNENSFEPLLKRKEGARANFPVFMKLVVVLLVFGFLPFLVITLFTVWNYDATFRGVLDRAAFLPEEQEAITYALKEAEHALRIRLGFLFLVTSVFMVGGIWIASRMVVNPLTKFLGEMEKLSRGEFRTRISSNTSDEFTIFADYFNRMAEHLEFSHKREAWVSRAKSQLLGLAAHQLRTPLTAIQWIFYGLQNEDYGKLAPQQKKIVGDGVISTKRMIHLVASLLDITAIEEGRFGYRFRPVRIEELLKSIEIDFQVLAASRGVTFEVFAEKLLPEAFVDPQKIRLVLENLASNAIQYTPQGGKVKIRAVQEKRRGARNAEIVISVQDTGIGMTEQERKEMFTRFFRTQKAAEMHQEGSGLGLYISKNIIERHGGSVMVESEKGKGSTFTFTIPISKDSIPKQEASEQFFIE